MDEIRGDVEIGGRRKFVKVLVIAIVVVLLIIAGWVIYHAFKKVSEDGVDAASNSDLEILEAALIENENVQIIVQRNSIKGDLVGINFNISDGESFTIIRANTTMQKKDNETFTFSLGELNLTTFLSVSIAPIYLVEEDGSAPVEVVSETTDTSTGSGSSGGGSSGTVDTGDTGDTPVAANCSDGIMNQDETGVDCGGSCDACATTYLRTFYVSTSGDDSNNGNTTDVPWQTLTYAESQATTPGDVIALERGDVWEMSVALGIHHGGTEEKPITWDGNLWGEEWKGKAEIHSINDRNPPNNAIVNIIGCRHVVFQNIVVDGNANDGWGIVVGGGDNYNSPGSVQDNEHDITVQDCEVKNIGNDGIYAIGILVRPYKTDMSNITIRRNTVQDTGAHGISLYPQRAMYLGGVSPKQLRDSYIGYNNITNYRLYSGNTGNGIHINNNCTNIIVEHNIINDKLGKNNCLTIESNEPLLGYYPTNLVIRYNTIYNKIAASIITYGGEAVTADIYGNNIVQTDSGNYGRAIDIHTGYDYTWARFNVYHNTIYLANDSRGFYDGTNIPGACTFKNNLIYNTGTNYCVHSTTSDTMIHSNNLCFMIDSDLNYVFEGDSFGDNKQIRYDASNILDWESSAIVADPLFVNMESFDFRLQEGSPAIGAGVAIPGITHDKDGVAYNDPPSIGAYEYTG